MVLDTGRVHHYTPLDSDTPPSHVSGMCSVANSGCTRGRETVDVIEDTLHKIVLVRRLRQNVKDISTPRCQ